MGTTLTGTQINNTYDGLIKTTDNTAITATTKLISDGLGNDTCIKVGTAGTDFLGNVDFSAATVTGLPGGAAGLVSGTGADSMQSDASLTTVAANAAGNCSIALGDNASTSLTSVSIGRNAKTDLGTGGGKVAVGVGACACGDNGISIGNGAQSNGQSSVTVGILTDAIADYSIAIGRNTQAQGACSVSIGCASSVAAVGSGSIAIGENANAASAFQVSIGRNTTNVSSGGVVVGNSAGAGTTGIAIGQLACVQAAGVRGIAIGCSSDSLANEAVAIGCGVQASIAQTVSVRALETQTASTPTAGGIIMVDAGSTSRRLNIDASGNLQIDSTPVGGGAAGLVNGTGTDSLKNADSLVTTPADSNYACDIAIGNGALTNVGATGTQAYGAIAIGNNATACLDSVTIGGNNTNTNSAGALMFGFNNSNNAANGSIAIGANNSVTAFRSIAIGNTATGSGQCSISLGFSINNIGTNSIAIGCAATGSSSGNNISLGTNAQACGGGSNIAIGNNACTTFLSENIAIGPNSFASGNGGVIAIGNGARSGSGKLGVVAVGNSTCVNGNNGTAIGANTKVCGVDNGTSVGYNSRACANGAVALGNSVHATRANTVASCQFEACVVGKGIVVTSPDGLTTLGIGIDNSGNIVTYTP